MTCTLVLMRHGKSDWSVDASDHDRPLTDRGRRQAAEAGQWLERHGGALDVALVSTAERAWQAWSLAAAELSEPPAVRTEPRAYTFDGLELLAVVRSLTHERRVVLVGHNPACEELLDLLTGEQAEMKTSALAVVHLADWRSPGTLVTHGRPPPEHPDLAAGATPPR